MNKLGNCYVVRAPQAGAFSFPTSTAVVPTTFSAAVTNAVSIHSLCRNTDLLVSRLQLSHYVYAFDLSKPTPGFQSRTLTCSISSSLHTVQQCELYSKTFCAQELSEHPVFHNFVNLWHCFWRLL